MLGGVNLYSYVQNNPVNKIDFLGLDEPGNGFGPDGTGMSDTDTSNGGGGWDVGGKFENRDIKEFPEEHVDVNVTVTDARGLFDRVRENSPVSGDNSQYDYESKVESIRENIRSGNIREAIRDLQGLPSDPGEHDMKGGSLFDTINGKKCK